jgi:hypothetical protein
MQIANGAAVPVRTVPMYGSAGRATRRDLVHQHKLVRVARRNDAARRRRGGTDARVLSLARCTLAGRRRGRVSQRRS